jgi:hypothetical protein
MDIEAAYNELKTALESISTYDSVLAVAKHPDVWIRQSTTFPIVSLLFSEGNFEHETGDKRWSEAMKSRAEFELHLIITSSTDGLALEILRQVKAIQAKVIATTLGATAQFRYYLSNVQTAYAETGKWGWAVMRIVAGP